MKKSLLLAITIIAISLISLSCSTRPSSVLNDKDMIELLQDIYTADGIFKKDRDRYNTSQQKDALINGVLKKHDITQKQLDESLAWYADNIEQYTAIQDTINARMQRNSNDNNALLSKQYSYKISGFDTDLPDYFVLDVSNPTFRFNVDSAKLAKLDIENYKLSFNTQGIDTTQHRIEASIYYKYKDTVVVDKKKLKENTAIEFLKPNIADSLLYEMSGYVHMVMATENMSRVILKGITNTKMQVKPDSAETSIDRKRELKPRFRY